MTLIPPPEAPPGNAAGAAGAGSLITISFRPAPFLPVRLRWSARIEAFAWNEQFCDVETAGPFAYWHHCHRVSAEQQGGKDGTRITDEVRYTLPLGPLGPPVNALFMHWQVKAIFAFRKQKTRELLRQAPG